jgi:hypothetical protein
MDQAIRHRGEASPSGASIEVRRLCDPADLERIQPHASVSGAIDLALVGCANRWPSVRPAPRLVLRLPSEAE